MGRTYRGKGNGMKHPYIVAWISEEGRRKSSSFNSAGKRDALAKTLLDRGLTVWIADQLQIFTEEWQPVSQAYDPRYDIPY